MRPSGMPLRFLLSSLVNGCLFSQSGFHLVPDVHHPESHPFPSRVHLFCCFQQRHHTGATRSTRTARESFCGLAFERIGRLVPHIVLLKRCDCPSFPSHWHPPSPQRHRRQKGIRKRLTRRGREMLPDALSSPHPEQAMSSSPVSPRSNRFRSAGSVCSTPCCNREASCGSSTWSRSSKPSWVCSFVLPWEHSHRSGQRTRTHGG